MTDEGTTGRRLTRRRLLIGTAAVAGGGLALSWFGGRGRPARIDADPSVLEPNAWLQLRPDGEIFLQVDKLEMGQGVTTGFVTLIAEELGVHPSRITPMPAPVHVLFQDPSQTTAESQSMRGRYQPLREVGAAAREMLVSAAATRWGVARAEIGVSGDATLVNQKTGDELAYADLAAAAARLDVPDEVELKTRDSFRWIGGSVARPDVPEKVAGATTYGIDVDLPGQLTAIVVRCPHIGGELLRFDATAVEAAPGIYGVARISSGVAILGDTFWHAQQAATLLDAEWSPSPVADLTVGAVHDRQREIIESGDLLEARDDGEVEAAFENAARVVEAEYRLPYCAHATMEPMTATVRLAPDRCDLWTATQSPDLSRQVVADLVGISRDDVHVHVLPAGGGFGRRFMNDFVAEATEVALQADRPVKLVWSREDDIRHDFYHSANLHRLRAALDETGQSVGWDHRLVVPHLSENFMATITASVSPEWVPDAVHETVADWLIAGFARFLGPFQAWDGSKTMPYDVGSVWVGMQGLDAGIPIGIWRSVGNHFNAFAVESFIDELAHEAGEDPLEFRLQRLGSSPRHVAVLERVARESGWGEPADGRYRGIAVHGAYDSVVGQVAEISIEKRRPRVHRVTCVVDCGIAINPDVVRQQMESGIIFGMTAALFDEIEFENGRVRQSNFHDYRMARMADAPAIDVHILDSDEPPGGVGEAGTTPIAPAIANAVFAATGRRVRKLPIRV